MGDGRHLGRGDAAAAVQSGKYFAEGDHLAANTGLLFLPVQPGSPDLQDQGHVCIPAMPPPTTSASTWIFLKGLSPLFLLIWLDLDVVSISKFESQAVAYS